MIALQNQTVADTQHINDMLGNRPGIGQHPQAMQAVGKNILDGFTRVVRDRKRMDLKDTDCKRLMAVDQTTLG